jgi:hypothetical protein
MSTDEKIIKNKMGLLKLSELLGQRLGGLEGHGLFPRRLLPPQGVVRDWWRVEMPFIHSCGSCDSA